MPSPSEEKITKLRPPKLETTFHLIVMEALYRKGHMSRFQLSDKIKKSPSYISRILSGERPLTQQVAKAFAETLDGSDEEWLLINSETKDSKNRIIDNYVDRLFGAKKNGDKKYWGIRHRKLPAEEILELFGDNKNGEFEQNGVCEACTIEGFNSKMVSPTTYDLTAGSYALEKDSKGEWSLIEATGDIVIPARRNLIVGAKEFIHFPKWLEAELAPASNIVLKPLQVTNGSVVDPDWPGYLKVSVFNPTDEDVRITLDEPFLTLRFWVSEEEGSERK